LYSFSKDAWHVKLYKWLYDVDPTKKYKNMCPYFWSLIITFILLPFMVILKLFGNLSSKYYKWNYQRKEDKYQKRKSKFLEYCNRDLTPEEAYILYNSNEWRIYSGFISDDIWHKIYDLCKQHKPIYKKKLDVDWDLVLIGVLFTSLLGVVGFLIWSIEWRPIDWKLLGKLLLDVGNIVVFVVGFYHIWKYLFINSIFFNFLDIIWNFIKNVASKIWHGIQIVSDMIYNIYKNNCPLIEWKEDEKI